jgi:hypothetical protein
MDFSMEGTCVGFAGEGKKKLSVAHVVATTSDDVDT